MQASMLLPRGRCEANSLTVCYTKVQQQPVVPSVNSRHPHHHKIYHLGVMSSSEGAEDSPWSSDEQESPGETSNEEDDRQVHDSPYGSDLQLRHDALSTLISGFESPQLLTVSEERPFIGQLNS